MPLIHFDFKIVLQNESVLGVCEEVLGLRVWSDGLSFMCVKTCTYSNTLANLVTRCTERIAPLERDKSFSIYNVCLNEYAVWSVSTQKMQNKCK